MKRALLVLAVLLVAGCASEGPEKDSPLAARWKDELAHEAPLDSSVAVFADDHFLLVGGFLNELIPGYLEDNARLLRQELRGGATVRFPSSEQSLSEDADQIRDAALECFARTRRPVVIVGHSKGGAGAVLAALRNPELVLAGPIACVIAVQGALGGSPVADAIAWNGSGTVGTGFFRGLESLTTGASRSLFATELERVSQHLSDEAQRQLSGRIFFARSYEPRLMLVPGELQLTHAYLGLCGSGRNDGLLLVEDMKLDDFGEDLGVVLADHAALTVTGILSTSSRTERETFTRALLREVAERLVRAEPVRR